MTAAFWQARRRFGRLPYFLALSRTPHGLVDMATPALAALVWLGAFPPAGILLLGLFTAFAGYTAVYALNDLVDYRNDREKARRGLIQAPEADLDAVLMRHPLAQGVLTLTEGIAWTVFWAVCALAGAYLLNPWCMWIFLAGILLEAAYCLLWRVSHYRALISGVVKTLGAIAAVFAVEASPAPLFLLATFLFFFFWEIGGQNIPNDWADLSADQQMRARTIPVKFGLKRASILILICILTTLALNVLFFNASGASYGAFELLAALLAGVLLLLQPGLQLYHEQTRTAAMILFNRASYYPLALLVIVVAGFYL